MVQGEDDITVYPEQLPPRGDKLRSFCSMERLATAVAINPRISSRSRFRDAFIRRSTSTFRLCGASSAVASSNRARQ